MNNLGFINKLDKYRVLLTEVLPYETPLWFTNEFFHMYCCDNSGIENSKLPAFLKNYLVSEGKKQNNRIPLDYRIKKDTYGERNLSVMHPGIQLEVVDFYEKYKDILIYFCDQEDISLRKPVKIASRFIKSKHADNQESIGVEEDDNEREYSSSFFVYQKIGFIYKFYESYEFHRLEKKYPLLIKLDVARCFNHIYTHSISWAVKSKDFVKDNLRPSHSSFYNDFDKLMQSSNYNETNGIIIGPEVSRIFAEIIFQRIDRDIIYSLDKKNVKYKEHYEFRRYVDDYFFFYKNELFKEMILDSINQCLEYYRLYINENKVEFSERPFISDLTMCKRELLNLINIQFGKMRYEKFPFSDKNTYETANTKFKKIRKQTIYRSSLTSNRFIVDIKMIVKKYDVQYRSISGFFLSCMRRKVQDSIRKIRNLKSNGDEFNDELINYKAWLLVDIEMLFFIYSMDFRVRPTIIVARIIQKILSVIDDDNDEIENLIVKKIFDGGMTVLKNHEMNKTHSTIEILNLILILSKLGDDYLISEERLISLFLPCENVKSNIALCYFEWVTLMLITKNNPKYAKLKIKLINNAKYRFETEKWHLGHAEKFIFVLDFLSCPFVEKSDKEFVIRTLLWNEKGVPSKKGTISQYIHIISKSRWFVDWNDDDWLEKRLKKKEFTFPYS
ncbi:MAG: RNA-directed DNA polymerase [Desulfatibacillum sp.]|nr:RNA-directed DNA polymerase [Desulfatibacillum sp.]